MSSNQIVNDSKSDLFAIQISTIMNYSATALMISIGHRTGLFDTMAMLPPATSHEIATAAQLNERYVREWLGAMVTARIIEFHADKEKYELPPEHAAFLTRAAAPNNMAVGMQFISVLGSVEDKIVDCFRNGGGVPYSEFQRFHEVMAEESYQTIGSALIDHILPLVPGLGEALHAGIDVLDVGCGSGHSLNLLALAFSNSRFVGYDFSAEAITRAREEAERLGLTNVRFQIQDAAVLNDTEQFDLITAFDAIHDQAQPNRVLRNIAKALHPQGVFLMQDISGSSHLHKDMQHPFAPFLYTISCMHCMTVSLAHDGAGLGAMWGQAQALEMLAAAGFAKVEVKQLPHDVMNNYYIARKS